MKNNISSSSSIGEKRQRDEQPHQQEEDTELITTDSQQQQSQLQSQSQSLEESLTFSDTSVAIRIMHAQFPTIEKTSISPFVLRSQLYSSVKDRTQVDRELESLRRQKFLRIFKLNTGQDDDAIMLMVDYMNQVESVVKRMQSKRQDSLEIFEWFKEHIISFKLEASIGHQELCSLLSCGGKVKDEDISLLINAGLLTRQLIDPNMYWFAIPNIGSVLKGLSQVCSFLSICCFVWCDLAVNSLNEMEEIVHYGMVEW